MSSVRQRNTGPELTLRRLVFAEGFRFRLHRKDLPGCPDIVFPSQRKVIFVHGCFWHGHNCAKGKLPKSRTDYWVPKIARNRERDVEQVNALLELGWSVLTVWQCEMKDLSSVSEKVHRFLAADEATAKNPNPKNAKATQTDCD